MTWPEATHQPLEGWQADTSSAERDPKALLPSRCDTCPRGRARVRAGEQPGPCWPGPAHGPPRPQEEEVPGQPPSEQKK